MPSSISFADFVSLLNSPPADVATLTGSDRCVISRVNDRDIRPTVLRTTLDPDEFDEMISSVAVSDLWSDVDRKTAALRLLSVHVFEELGSDHPSDEYELVLGSGRRR